jgi:hypothetical protein
MRHVLVTALLVADDASKEEVHLFRVEAVGSEPAGA